MIAKLKTAFNRFRGIAVETDLEDYARTVRKIRELHETEGISRMSGQELAGRTAAMRTSFEGGPSADDEARARIGAYALALEAARRGTGLDAHDVQIVAGLAMADG